MLESKILPPNLALFVVTTAIHLCRKIIQRNTERFLSIHPLPRHPSLRGQVFKPQSIHRRRSQPWNPIQPSALSSQCLSIMPSNSEILAGQPATPSNSQNYPNPTPIPNPDLKKPWAANSKRRSAAPAASPSANPTGPRRSSILAAASSSPRTGSSLSALPSRDGTHADL